MGFKLLPPKTVTGEKDWVYGILTRGRRLSTGDRVSIDTPLTLLIGSGQYDDIGGDIQFEDASSLQTDEGAGDEDDFEEVFLVDEHKIE